MALNYLSLRNYVEPNVSIGNLSVSTLSGSTVTGTSSGVFPSTLTVSTLTGSTVFGSALSGSTLSVSSLTGSALSLQTLSTTSATLTSGNLLLNTGKLGIGTNAPSAYLTVNGSITINSLNGVYEPGCIYSDVNWGMLFRGTVSTPTNSHFGWYSADGTQLMRIGIGNDFVVSTSLTSYLGNGLYTNYNDLGFTAATIAAGSFPYGGTITGPIGGVYTFTAANGSSYILLPVTLIIGVTYKVSITARSSSSTTLLVGNNIATAYYQSPTLTSTLTTYTFSFVASGSTQLTVGPVPAGAGVVLEWSAFSLSKMDTTVTGSLGIGGSTPKTRLSIYHNGTVSTIGSSYTQFAGLHLAPSGTDYSYTGITFGGNTIHMDTTQAGIICQSSPFMGTKLIFQTTNSYVDGGFNRMTIDAVGNVGIGTTTPTTSLEINTSTTTAGILSTRYYLRAPGDNQDSTGNDNAYGPWYGLGWSGITGIAGDPIPCLTGYSGVAIRSGLGYIYLNQAGNVGIGTTNPGEKLHVAGNYMYLDGATSSSANSDFRLIISKKTESDVATVIFARGGNTVSSGFAEVGLFGSYLGFKCNTSAGSYAVNPQVVLVGSGVIGIGTTQPHLNYNGSAIPNACLTLHKGAPGSEYASARISIGGNANHYSAIEGAHTTGGATTLAFMTCTNATTNSSNPLTRMFINSTGNIGIGTENPVTSLHIARSVVTSNTDFSLMTYYENTYESYHDWAIGPYIHNNAAAFAIRSGSNNLPSGLTNLLFIDGYGTAIQFPAYTTTGTMTMNSGGLITSGSSDRRIKENIIYQTNTSDALSRVLQLKPATFNYISGSAIHLGFIAQDVEQFIPEAVDGKKYEWLWEVDSNGNPRFGENGQPIYRLDKDGNRIIRPRSIDDRALIAMQTLAIQELVNRSTSQQQKIESLESQLASLLSWAQAQGFTA